MKLFDKDGAWNWVDENNVVLGFRNTSDCCENFGYHYEIVEPKDMSVFENISGNDPDLTTYRFDPSYFSTFPDNDGGGNAVFRIVSDFGPSFYLLIYNHHNGYYCHGFKFTGGGKNIEDSL